MVCKTPHPLTVMLYPMEVFVNQWLIGGLNVEIARIDLNIARRDAEFLALYIGEINKS